MQLACFDTCRLDYSCLSFAYFGTTALEGRQHMKDNSTGIPDSTDMLTA